MASKESRKIEKIRGKMAELQGEANLAQLAGREIPKWVFKKMKKLDDKLTEITGQLYLKDIKCDYEIAKTNKEIAKLREKGYLDTDFSISGIAPSSEGQYE